jgi:tRNA dimethylallyltransferase
LKLDKPQKAVIVCGPTASGKTDFAHRLAKASNGEIINADSMQIYRQIPLITSSPEGFLQEELNYHLYNFLDITSEYSVVKYTSLAAKTIRNISSKGKIPIIVGGTGLYISSLLYGYNQLPDIKDEIRVKIRELKNRLGLEKFFDQLILLDPLAKEKLKPQDSQRVLRAYEVFEQTKRSIFSFHLEEKILPLAEFEFRVIFLLPERRFLYNLCNERLVKMFKTGAIEEIESIYKNHKELNNSAMKALGVTEIISFLKGELSKTEAIEIASAKTRQFAKRQITWFRHQLKDKETIEFSNREEYNTISYKK